MKITRKIFVISVLFVILLGAVYGGAAYAINTTDHSKHYDLAFFVDWGDHVGHVGWWYNQEGEKDFTDIITIAADAWSRTPTPIKMVQVDAKAESVLRIYSNDYGDTGWYAEYNATPDSHIGLNEHYRLNDSDWEIVASHEMGHAHGLNHYNECELELMYFAPTGRGNCYPFIGDISGINDKYD